MLDTQQKSITLKADDLEIVYLKPREVFEINGVDYETAQIEIIGSDVILINSVTDGKIVFPGLGLILFDEEQAPNISLNGQVITPKMFGNKIGTVSNINQSDYVSFTSLDISNEKPEEQNENTQIKVIEELEQEKEALQQQLEEVTEINEDTEFLLASVHSENAQLQAQTLEAKIPPEDEPREFHEIISSGAPPEDSNIFTSNDDSSATSSSSAVDVASDIASVSSSVSTFSFKAFLLQPGVSESTENILGVPTFVVRGGGGNADSTFNPDNTIQLSSEVLDYSSRTDDIVIYSDDGNLFDDTNLTRSIEMSSALPDGFDVASVVISGLPAGYEVIGSTVSGANHILDLTGATLTSRGGIQFNLKYPIPATQAFDMQISVAAIFDPASGVTPAPDTAMQTFILTQKVEQKDVSVPADLNFTDADGDLVWVLANSANQNTILSGSGNDTLNGSGGIDVIHANAGNDTISAHAGNDTIDAGDGDDIIAGGLGSDNITGGTGTADLVDYTGRTDDIVLDMNVLDGSGYASATIGAGGEVDLIRQVENITGGDGNDTITGDDGDNILTGGLGNDVLDGGLGADTIDGGLGTDTISFISGSSGLTVNLGTGSAIDVGSGIKTISNIENITATNFDDMITATGGDNAINGANGNDIFITDGGGDDTFDGGFLGVDTGGNDRIDYTTSLNGTTIDLGGVTDVNGFLSVSVGANTDLIKNIEDIYGSDAASDTITGDSSAQELRGNGGDDILDGSGGDDDIYGGTGSDILNGGSTSETNGDTLHFNNLGTAVTLNLVSSSAGTATSGADTDNFTNFENYILSEQDDIINSSNDADTVTGGGGNDTFFASAGADTFDGGAGSGDIIDYSSRGAGIYIEADLSALPNLTVDVRNSGDDSLIEQDIINNIENVTGSLGNDRFINGAANNTIDGGVGSDTLSYENDATGISFNMKLTTGGFYDIAIGAQLDSVSNIENITGSTGGDSMAGDTATNNFDGNSGDDTFIASEGGDTYTGGLGNDFVNYSTLAGLNNVAANLATRTASLDLGVVGADAADSIDTYLDDIENLSGTVGNDTLTGNAFNNIIYDLGGDDVIDGGAGTNTINYSLLTGQNVIVDLDTGTADDDGGAGALDTLTNFQNVTGSDQNDTITGNAGINVLNGGLGVDTIFGNDSDDMIDGGAGNDDIDGGLGNDNIDGGTGIDRVLYTGANAVSVNLSTGSATDGGGGIDTLTSIEEVTGSNAGDIIIAGADTAEIDSSNGDDTITSNIQLGTARINNIDAGAGNDIIDYTATPAITGASINGTVANIGLSGNTDIVTNAESFRLGNAGDQFSIDTNAISLNLNEFDGNGGTDSITVTTGAAGDLTASDIDGDTLAGLFSDIEEFDFRGTDLTGADTFDISDAQITSITSGGDSLSILIEGTNISLSDFNFLPGGGISNIDADPDPNVQLVQWSSGAELTVSVV